MTTQKIIDTSKIIKYLAKHPNANAAEIQQHVGGTITGVRSRLQKMVVAGSISVKRVGSVNHYAVITQTTLQNQTLFNSLLRGVQQRRVAL